MTLSNTREISAFGIFVWLLAILFFFYEFFLRIFLGTVANEVQESLHLSIRQFSIVGAAYYITYGLMQIPVGFITEKMGTRITLSFAAFICTVGVFWLSRAHSFYPALISRLLIGFGSSFAFVSLLILSLNWFPRKYFGFICGISLFLGAVGPMLAGAPLAYLMSVLDGNWRAILYGITAFGVLLTLALILFMRDKPAKEQQEIIFITPHEPIRKKLRELLKNRQAWFVLLSASAIYCPLPLLAAYFGTSYLQARGFGKTHAAFIISMIWIGYAIGNPTLGKLSDYTKRRTPFLYLCSFLGCLVSVIILYIPLYQNFILISLFFLLGVASSAQGLAYALIVEHTPQTLNSVALGLNNAGVMLFGAIFPSMAGFIIQTTLYTSGNAVATAAEYSAGLSLIPLLYMVAGGLALFCIQETFCRQQHEIHKLQPFHTTSRLL